jgi:flagellar motor component MotA
VLLIATSVAVLVFFARDRREYSAWRVRIAPALGLIGLVGSLILILANLKDLVGGSSILAWVIIGLLIGGFVAGAVIGARVRDKSVAAS